MRARSTQFAEKIQRDQIRDQQRPRSDDGTFRDVAAPSRLLRKTCEHGADESAPDRVKSPRVYAGVERKGWPETRSRPVVAQVSEPVFAELGFDPTEMKRRIEKGEK